MKKTKIQQRIENAFNAFYADENAGENTLNIYRNEFNMRRERNFEETTQTKISWETVLKQTLLFFPGTFVLYLLSMGFPVVLTEILTAPRRYISFYPLLFLAAIFIAAALMTWLGLGDMRKQKHFVIPASIISVGLFFGSILGVLLVVARPLVRMIFDNGLLLYIFPLALIVPFLAKGWVDRNSQESETRTK